ncbi:hypothetical protein [Ostreibacterium oceani]|uniref:Uncharacterized protein n=1 Tax=Ostreibacterium oceani TaxID=2654998 RepID=A0A6N7F286_9GAMM|nr:hypothetical protein [Ostreibacterium oceani]MPV86908.1 hypothetical protein [Ostreibacterium oceani]
MLSQNKKNNTDPTDYPSWADLTPDQQAAFGNGCGASWMPDWLITALFGWFFEASCRHHDFGYAAGGNERRRWHCDWQFARAMYRDTRRCKTLRGRIQTSIALVVFYAAVALFGWTKFAYGRVKTHDELLAHLNTKT